MDEQDKLIYASSEGDLEQVYKLLLSGVDINCRDKHGRTPLWVACYRNQIQVVKYLLSDPRIKYDASVLAQEISDVYGRENESIVLVHEANERRIAGESSKTTKQESHTR